MKSYTDLEQSKKLAGILPIESADMFWLVTSEPRLHVLTEPLSNYDRWEHYPAWSLSALLEILEDTIDGENGETYHLRIYKEDGEYVIAYQEECGDDGLETDRYEELIDAFVEMIIKLKVKNLL